MMSNDTLTMIEVPDEWLDLLDEMKRLKKKNELYMRRLTLGDKYSGVKNDVDRYFH